MIVFPYAASLFFGPSFLYPWLRRRDASVHAAAAGSLLVPVLWLVKECHAIEAIFSFWEAVYYAFNPLSLGLFTAAALQMAVCELLVRRARAGRWELANGASLVIGAIAVVAGVFAVIARRHDPTIAFWAYIELHRRLFGG